MLEEVPTSTLHRASRILDALGGTHALNLTQIVARTGLPRSSVHRTLERLVGLRWVTRQGGDYALGLQILELGSTAMHTNPLRKIALPSLCELYRATECIVHLGILEGTDVVYLEKLGGHLDTRVPTRAGGRYPAHLSAIGKCLLATSGTGRNSADLNRIRQHGLAYDHEVAAAGYSCVAAPIGRGPTGGAIAAVSVCGPAVRVSGDPMLRLPVQRAAAQIWREWQRNKM
ncbi:IclR family transcriptional regulator [Speluncibacter jeojiensis]|uniref:IclR family transcriptional regulator n=1 Tax=Speluncibacter jeojiensis TaxID=2710754 RepID=A0A9X4RC98_9ACTN|nr:IclR family transcriptional regulator [Rhodococcus sp. D2-41]MDG3013343.1 IclR family transcriptional regulator [Corynebacteriales bacterium D3-21]